MQSSHEEREQIYMDTNLEKETSLLQTMKKLTKMSKKNLARLEIEQLLESTLLNNASLNSENNSNISSEPSPTPKSNTNAMNIIG